jgi:hypothetical protein
MGMIIGGPEKPEKDDRSGFFVHKNLVCYLDVQPDGVYLEGKEPSGRLLWRKHFVNNGAAMHYVETLKSTFEGEHGKQTGESG